VVLCGFCCHWNKKGEVDSRDPLAMHEENGKPKNKTKSETIQGQCHGNAKCGKKNKA
jgi:hypothetical protein